MTSRGIRNNNPGNIERSRIKWDGMSEDQSADSRFVVFDEPMWGIRAIAKILHTYFHHRLAVDGSRIDTVAEITTRWAPSHENDVDSYANHIRLRLRVEVGKEIDLDDIDVLSTVVETIILHENGEQPYDNETIMLGINAAREV